MVKLFFELVLSKAFVKNGFLFCKFAVSKKIDSMQFKRFKSYLLKKRFDKLVVKALQTKKTTPALVKTVGILTTEAVSLENDLQNLVETTLGVRNTKLYSFQDSVITEEKSFKHFTEKDFSWNGKVLEASFENFLAQPFDLLISCYDESNLYLEMATLKSEAGFKVGFSEVNSQLFEIEIASDTTRIGEFLSELKKYLQVLKKL